MSIHAFLYEKRQINKLLMNIFSLKTIKKGQTANDLTFFEYNSNCKYLGISN